MINKDPINESTDFLYIKTMIVIEIDIHMHGWYIDLLDELLFNFKNNNLYNRTYVDHYFNQEINNIFGILAHGEENGVLRME